MSREQKIDRILSATTITELEVTESKVCFNCNRSCKGCIIDNTIISVRGILNDKIGI